MTVVHLPVYPENAYQPLLMESLRKQGVVAIEGGGGGNFFRTALFKWQADILHFHWLHPYLLRSGRFTSLLRSTRFLLEAALLRLAGARIVWTVHNLANHDRHFHGLERFCTRLFVRLADGVIVHSPTALAATREAFHLGEKKLTAVIPQGSYVGCYPNIMSKADCREQLGLPADQFVFVLLGRIEPYKGVLELIQAFRQMPEDVHLLIAGRIASPQSLILLQTAIGHEANIHLHAGFVPDDRVQIFLNAADAYVYPVREILNSGSVSLAMSFGLPCVAPHLPGVVDALGTEGGILYPPDSPDGLLEAMRQAVGRKAELRRMGEKNLARAMAWTWLNAAQLTRELYAQCLEK